MRPDADLHKDAPDQVNEIFWCAPVNRDRACVRRRSKLHLDRQQPTLCMIEVLLDHGLLPPFQHGQLQRVDQRADRRDRLSGADRRALVQCHLAVTGQRPGVPDGQQAAAGEKPVRQPLIGNNAQQCRDVDQAEPAAAAHLAAEAVRAHSKCGSDVDRRVPFLDDQYAAEQSVKTMTTSRSCQKLVTLVITCLSQPNSS
jgi:hypothetical protein